MNASIKKLYNEVQEDIAFYSEMGDPPANRLSGALKSIRGIALRLKAEVIANGFANEAGEIRFFKQEKPLFIAEQIYLSEYTTILLGKPAFSQGLLEAYYSEELRRIQIFINRF